MKKSAIIILSLFAAVAVDAAERADSTGREGPEFVTEFSISPRNHGVTPVMASCGIELTWEEIWSSLGLGYQYMLQTHYNGGDKNYVTADGLYAAVDIDVVGMFRKKPSQGALHLKFAHSLGDNDFTYSLYEVGIKEMITSKSPIGLGVGYRFIKSHTRGVRCYSGIYFSLSLII